MEQKEGFTSKIGYVFAAAGSAIGLGNIWRFPYLTAKYGGGIFLLTYFILVLTFGYALLISENCIGRMTGKGPIGAYRDLCAGKKPLLGFVRCGGWINALAPLIIVPYYCVIGGWVAKYCAALACNPIEMFSSSATVTKSDGSTMSFSANYFVQFITSTWEPLIYFLLFMLLLTIVVAFGVEKGVERFNKILMPCLFAMIIAVCIYCFFIPNAGAGYRYYLMPDVSKFGYMTVVAAMGQLFFSLSIAMGIMFTYGSYMRKTDDLVSSVRQVEFFDTTVAFLAGLMIIPAVVAFGGKEAAEAAGPGLVFITMPQVFASFPGGRFFGIIFFLLVLFAAATSAISLLETNIQTVCQELKISRKKSIALCVGEILGIGSITVLGYSALSFVHPLAFIERYKDKDILDSLDFISNSVLMPIGAIFTVILVVAVIGLDKMSAEIRQSSNWHREFIFRICMKYIVIPCLLIVLLNALDILH